MRSAGILLAISGLVRAACIEIPSDKIRARDIASVVPQLQSLDPDAVVGLSPFPGTERVLSSRDLLLAARRLGLDFQAGETPPSLCVKRITHSFSAEEVRAALLAGLDNPDAKLELLEFTNKPLPPGQLVFELATLNKPPQNNPETPVVWPGKLIYDDHHSLSVWAKVRISIQTDIFVANETIQKGEVIRMEQIAVKRVQRFQISQRSTTDSLVGKVARRPIAAGTEISPDAFEVRNDVRQGESVHVKVMEGMATVSLDGVAQSSGNKGDTILVHNPSSGKSFRAVVEDRSRVVVAPDTDGDPAPRQMFTPPRVTLATPSRMTP